MAVSLLVLVFCSAHAVQATKPLDRTAGQTEIVQFLKDLIRIDTQEPPGNESRIAIYLQSVLAKEGIESKLLEPISGRASVVARLRGDGSKRPLLLMAHEDVVPVDRSRWTVEPLAAVQRGEVIYGRGASDDKAMLAANLAVILQLKRMNRPLARDVIFLAEASEEAPSQAGMATLVEHYGTDLDCEFALNEGGNSLLEQGRVKYMGIGTAEKLPRGVRLEATGSGGHGSIPRADNAVVHLAAAVSKIGAWELTARVNETTREFFRRLAAISSPEEAAWYGNILDPHVQQELKARKPSYYAMLRSTIVPTMLAAGNKINVIPTTAEASLDVRALPDEDLPKLLDALASVIDDPQVRVIAGDTTFFMPATPVTNLNTEMFVALERAQRAVAPQAVTLPMMGDWRNGFGVPSRQRGTDLRHKRSQDRG